MSRILLLVLVLIWMAAPAGRPPGDAWPNIVLFFSFYVLLVVMLGLWSRLLARRVAADNFHRNVRWFNHVMLGARFVVPVWFVIGVWGLGWGGLISNTLGQPVYTSAPGMLLGTMPAFLTWMGLWWSQYPAERALREQNLLVELDNDLPMYRPPDFRRYFLNNFRMQILFTLAPVAMIVLVRDAIMWGYVWLANKPAAVTDSQVLETVASVIAAAGVFLFAPALLTRVLQTAPMPDSPLRKRLDAMCERAGVRYRHILVWDTNNHVGNAAVMGVMPWIRYVLLSDVLLERMSDEEIEAVFAHELGHVVHKHMTWYAVFFIVATLAAAVIGNFLNANVAAALTPVGVGGAFLLFGMLSRKCERQADVYAARTMEMIKSDAPLASESLYSSRQLATVGAGALVEPKTADQTPVGEHGAWLFSTALRRVAAINNIPVNPRTHANPGFWNHVTFYADGVFELASNFLHGSIASRMKYVEDLGADPRRTSHFDRTMFWLYCSLLAALFISAASMAVSIS